MNILFIGDIFGSPGRRIVADHLQDIVAANRIDLTIANGENAAGGFGITPQISEDLLALGIDVLTSGNHIWDKREIFDYLARQPRLLRPANYPEGPGSGVYLHRTAAGVPCAVINLQGRVYMASTDDPFRKADEILAALDPAIKVRFVDFHAEVTSEKMAMGWHLDGRVSAIVGTHTHIPTADTRVLPGGAAY
jgi:2',3'-cyclic-nucleotide 2'-phosphodiesterase